MGNRFLEIFSVSASFQVPIFGFLDGLRPFRNPVGLKSDLGLGQKDKLNPRIAYSVLVDSRRLCCDFTRAINSSGGSDESS